LATGRAPPPAPSQPDYTLICEEPSKFAEYGFTEDRIEQERFATMSYRGQIVLVASVRD
jgi:hypothetical protein